jgi:hypothetical protein
MPRRPLGVRLSCRLRCCTFFSALLFSVDLQLNLNEAWQCGGSKYRCRRIASLQE